MNASSTSFQKSTVARVSIRMCGFLQLRMRRPSIPILNWSRDTVLRSASDHGLSQNMIPTSMSRWHLFCQFIFCCALRAFLSLRLRGSINYCFFIYRLKGKFHHLGFGSKQRIENNIHFCQQCEFIFHSPFLPAKRRIGCRFVRERIDSEGCSFSCWLRHVVLY